MASAAKGLKAGNKLLYSEDHFQGYWVQLQTLVRKDDRADELLDGVIENPLETIAEAVYNGDPDDEADEKLRRTAELVKTLYENKRLGHPPGTFPPSIKDFKYNPLLHIKDFAIATHLAYGVVHNRRHHKHRDRGVMTHSRPLTPLHTHLTPPHLQKSPHTHIYTKPYG